MKRNYISKLFAGVATVGILGMASCSDDFLDPEPLSFYEPATTFSTESGLEAALAAADKSLRSYWSNVSNNVDLMLPLQTEYLFSDCMVASKTDDAYIFCDINERLTPTNGWYNFDQNRLTMLWEETFNGLKYANTVISYADQIEGLDEEIKNAYLGRAYFHRAWRYLMLCFRWGDVPLMCKIIDSPKQDYKSTKREAIIKKLIVDMEFAVQWVPEQNAMNYEGMVNKGACRMLLAKCYLANGDFQKAKEQMDVLINQSGYSLMTEPFGTFMNYHPECWNITRNVIWDLHRPENKYIAANTEAIMIMPNLYGQGGLRNRTMRNLVPWWNANAITTPDNLLACDRFAPNNASYEAEYDYNRTFGRGIGVTRPTWWAENSLWYFNGKHDDGDLRHSSKMGNWVHMEDLKYNKRKSAYFGQNLSREYSDPTTGETRSLCSDTIRAWFDWPHYKVYSESPEDEGESNNNYQGSGYGYFYLYRLAEAYLLRAEAEFYLGQTSAATDDVNTVRKRAGCDYLYSTVGIDDIADERARELYMEEWRTTELSRMSLCLALSGKADNEGNTYDKDKLSERSFWFHRITVYNNFYNKADAPTVKGRKYTMGAHNILWPIPQSAIDANLYGQLHQNYGYDGYDANCDEWQSWEEAVADEQ